MAHDCPTSTPSESRPKQPNPNGAYETTPAPQRTSIRTSSTSLSQRPPATP